LRRFFAILLAGLAMTAAPIAFATPAEAATTLNQRALHEAEKHYGAPYKYGAVGPSRFDCSGFTRYVFGRLGKSLPHSSAAQYNAAGVHHISRSQVRPGDLVFTIRSGKIRHVAIYAGGNAMWAATETGDIVRKQPLAGRDLVFARVG
jgi:cell wall-associated NlpC family hydrolase